MIANDSAEEYSAETYQVITDASDAADKDKAAISVGGLLAAAEIMDSEFKRVHVADQIDIQDVHAGFCRLRERVFGRKRSVTERLHDQKRVVVAPSRAIMGSPVPLPTPAFAITISTVFEGDFVTAASNSST